MFKNIYSLIKIKITIFLLLITFSQVSAQGFYLPNLAVSGEIKIMPLGNSITYGTGSYDLTSFRRPLFEKLINKGYGIDFVGSLKTGNGTLFDNDHEGHPGWHADQPNSTVRSIVDSLSKFLRNAQPEIILLHIGTNDLGEGQSPPELLLEVEDILDIIDEYEFNYTRETTVFLAQIINTSSVTTDRAERTSAYNDSLEALAARRINGGDKIILVNQEETLYNSPADYYDSTHPNNAGYEKMADVWFEALDNFFQNSNDQIIVTKQPENTGSVEGGDAIFSVAASSSIPIEYQWFKNNTPISGANSPVFNASNLTLADHNAEVYVRLSNSTNEVYSSAAELYVTASDKRVTSSLQNLYNFTEGDGSVVNDFSDNGEKLDLYINELDKVEWNFEGLSILQNSIIISNLPASAFTDSVKASNEISLEAWVKPENLIQTGPARIVTISSDALNRNITLGQGADKIEVRLRTTETSEQGYPSLASDSAFLSEEFIHLVYTRSKFGKTKIYSNGIALDSMQIEGDFSNWNDSMYLALGNEMGSERPWLGSYNLVALYNRALSENEVRHNFNMGLNEPVLDAPSNLTASENGIGFAVLNWEDNSSHESGFYIERKTGGADSFFVTGIAGRNYLSYIDSTVVENENYSYRLKAFNSTVESNYSNTATLKTEIKPVNAPQNLSAVFVDLPNRVILSWDDKAINETGFVVERMIINEEDYSPIDTLEADSETFVDTTVTWETTYYYRVYAFSPFLNSDYSPSSVVNTPVSVNENKDLIVDYNISQNYPNPFNPETKINFDIPEESFVSVKIYNSLGEAVNILLEEEIPKGRYILNWNAKNYSSGIYFYVITAESLISDQKYHQIKKMALVK